MPDPVHYPAKNSDRTRDPQEVAARALDALEQGREEVPADERTGALKRSMSTEQPYYLNSQSL